MWPSVIVVFFVVAVWRELSCLLMMILLSYRLPMYSEAKLAFIVYLWYPKTQVWISYLFLISKSYGFCNGEHFQGTSYVYESFFKPYIGKHEAEIDRNLLELRTRAGDMAVHYFQKIADYSHTRFYEILQYIASQSEAQRSRPQVLQKTLEVACQP